MENIVNTVNGVVWSNWLVCLCLLSGIYFSLRTRFSQVRNLKEMVHLLFAGEKSEEGISSFQGFCTALAGRIGTGNIAGVATAIAWGGPGALFWMWMIAFLGAGSAFAESTLGQLYKEKHEGQYCGGPAYYIEKGFGKKGWAKVYGMVFAIVTVISVGILLPGVQSNSIAVSVNNAFGVNVKITGIALVILVGVVIFGGIKRIGSAAEFIVPFMGGAYILMALIIIIVHIGYLPHVLALIFKSAFGAEATFGGILGSTIAWGVKRGVYSNEAGQGTGPQASSAAEVSHPAKQGFVQAIFNAGPEYTIDQIGPAYTQGAVNTLINGFGAAFVAIALFFFAFTTLMAYYYIAEVNVNYIVKRFTGKGNIWAVHALKLILLFMTYYGSVKTSDLAWAMGDIGVGLMAWLNIIAILALSNIVMKCFKDYEAQMKSGKVSEEITFDPVPLGIKGADFWEELNKEKTD